MEECHAKACRSSFPSQRPSAWNNGFVRVQRLNKLCFERESLSALPEDNLISKLRET